MPFKITGSPLCVTFVGTLFPRTKIYAARAAQSYTLTNVFNVWLGPRELDSPVCFCLQSAGARGRVRHRPRAAAGGSGPQHSPGLRRPATQLTALWAPGSGVLLPGHVPAAGAPMLRI